MERGNRGGGVLGMDGGSGVVVEFVMGLIKGLGEGYGEVSLWVVWWERIINLMERKVDVGIGGGRLRDWRLGGRGLFKSYGKIMGWGDYIWG